MSAHARKAFVTGGTGCLDHPLPLIEALLADGVEAYARQCVALT